MGFSIAFDPPLDFIGRQYGEFEDELRDLNGLWDRFTPLLSRFEQERFETEGFGGWPPLHASTVAQKEREGWPLDPMVRTGRLKRSLVDPLEAADVQRDRLVWGTDVEYAHYHQDGGSTPGRPPKRVLLDISVTQRRELQMATVDWVNEAAERAFGRAA